MIHSSATSYDSQPLVYHEPPTEKFSNTEYRDLPWAIIFLIHFFAVVGLAIYSLSVFDWKQVHIGDVYVDNSFIGYIFLIFLFALILCAIWMFMISRFTTCLIWTVLLSGVVIFMALGVYYFIEGQTITGVVFMILLIVNLIWIYIVRERIAFAAAVLKVSVKICQEYPAVFMIAAFSIFVQILWIFIWAFALFYPESQFYPDTSPALVNVSRIFFALSVYWTSQVIKNIVHVTIAGVVGTWYFYRKEDVVSPTMPAFQRAVTTSFGSICFGSLIVAIIQTIRAMLRSALKQGERNICLKICILWIVNLFERIIRYFNHYAYTYVAIYGMTFINAAKSTWNLFVNKGIDAVINDDLIGGVLMLGSVISGVLLMFVSYLFFCDSDIGVETECFYLIIISLITGFFLTFTAMAVINSAVATIFVCFAEDPARLASTKPSEYQLLTEAWAQRYPTVNFYSQPNPNAYV